MSYPPQGGGYPPGNGDNRNPDDNHEPLQSYDLYDPGAPYAQPPQGPGPGPQNPYGGGWEQQSPQAPQSPAGGYPGQYQPPHMPPPQMQMMPAEQPPRKSNTGLIAGVVIGSLVLLLAVTGGLILLSRQSGDEKDSSNGSDNKGSSQQDDKKPDASPTEVVDKYYKANNDRDWQTALDCLSKSQYDKFKDVPDSDRESAADQYEGTVYTVTDEKIAKDEETADVDVDIEYGGSTSKATLKMVVEDNEWKIDDFKNK